MIKHIAVINHFLANLLFIYLLLSHFFFSAFLWKTSKTRQTETNSINHHVLKRIYKRMEYEKEKDHFKFFIPWRKKKDIQ